MEPQTLFVVCLACILLIIAVLVYIVFSTRAELRKYGALIEDNRRSIRRMGEDVDVVLAKISGGIKYKVDSSAVSILDLAEFKDLDPYIKAAYRRHIVDTLAPAIADAFNRAFKAKDLEGYLDKHDREIDSAVYELSQRIRKQGIASVMP